MWQPEMLLWKKIHVFTQTLMLSCNAIGNSILQNYSTVYIFGAEENLGFFLNWQIRLGSRRDLRVG